MTAFASNLLSGLTGLGAKSGAGMSDVKTDGRVAGAFEALLAGMTAGGQVELAATATTTPDGVAPVQSAAAMVAQPAAPTADRLLAEGDVPVAGESTRESAPLDAALAGAEAVLLPQAPAVDPTVAAPPVDNAAARVVATAVGAGTAPSPDDLGDGATAVPDGAQDSARVAAADVAAPRPQAQVADPVAPKTGVRERVPILEAATASDAPVVAPEAEDSASAHSASPAPAVQASAAAPVSRTLPEAIKAPEVVSLAARVVEPARPSAAEAAAPSATAAAATKATVVDAVAAETVIERPIEASVAVEAPVVAEGAPAPQQPRRASRAEGRAEAARASVEALEPGLKAVASAEQTATDTASVDVLDAEPLGAQPVVHEAAQVENAPAHQPLTTAQGAAPQAHASAADASTVVRGSPETVARLASDIVRKLEGRSTRFDVQLDPLGLGKVDVSIEINADGRLSAALSFDSAQAAADLRGRASELRQALEKAGFDLTEASLSFDTGAQSGGFGGREPGEQASVWSSRAFASARAGLEQADAQLAAAAYARSPSGGVDIRI